MISGPLFNQAYAIAERLRQAGYQALFAGGCVRDALLEKTPQDYDIATSATPDQVESLFDRTIPVGKQFGVIIVLSEESPFEVATFRKEGGYQDGRHPGSVQFTGPQEDASRRDFTVNGLFYDPFEKRILDYVGGEKDLQKHVIRAIGNADARFQEDKLRLLRAIRFASSLSFDIDTQTWDAVRLHAKEILQVSPERIRDEVIKIFSGPHPARGFQLLSESGLMAAILPEIEMMKGVEQPPEYHPEGDVFIHTRMLLEKLEGGDLILALGALFHDIGKPSSFAIRDGRITFFEHASIGAEMTRAIMKRLKFSNADIDAVCECVANHMKFADVQKMRSGKLKQFVSRTNFMVEMELHRIDCLSSHGKLDNFTFLTEKIKEYAHQDLQPKPILNGHDFLGLGFTAGPALKTLLEEAYILQLEGRFANRDEALAWARGKRPL